MAAGARVPAGPPEALLPQADRATVPTATTTSAAILCLVISRDTRPRPYEFTDHTCERASSLTARGTGRMSRTMPTKLNRRST